MKMRVSRDGTQFAGVSRGGEIRLWDVATLEVVRTVTPEIGVGLLHFGDGWFVTSAGRSPRLATAAFFSEQGEVYEYDTTTWELVHNPWQAQQSKARGIAISPDDTKLAVSGEDGLVWIWQIDGDEPVRLDRIPAAANLVSDIMWIDDDRMGAALALPSIQGAWQILDLSVDVLIDKAIDGLVRGLSPEECTTYGIEPCPTLEEMLTR